MSWQRKSIVFRIKTNTPTFYLAFDFDSGRAGQVRSKPMVILSSKEEMEGKLCVSPKQFVLFVESWSIEAILVFVEFKKAIQVNGWQNKKCPKWTSTVNFQVKFCVGFEVQLNKACGLWTWLNKAWTLCNLTRLLSRLKCFQQVYKAPRGFAPKPLQYRIDSVRIRLLWLTSDDLL